MGVTPIYNIPFADPTDLVRDWPELSEDVADAVEAAIAGVPLLAGIGSNVVQTVKTNTFTTASTTFTPVTGFDVTITPSTDTSRILVIASYTISNVSDNIGVMSRLMRGSTVLLQGDADGSRTRSTYGARGQSQMAWASTAVFLDSPATDTAVTYSIEMRTDSATGVFNRTGQDANSSDWSRNAATITAIEVAA